MASRRTAPTSKGATVLLIHGLVGDLAYFEPQRRIHGLNVVTIDLLGYGIHGNGEPDSLSLARQAILLSGMARCPT